MEAKHPSVAIRPGELKLVVQHGPEQHNLQSKESTTAPSSVIRPCFETHGLRFVCTVEKNKPMQCCIAAMVIPLYVQICSELHCKASRPQLGFTSLFCLLMDRRYPCQVSFRQCFHVKVMSTAQDSCSETSVGEGR